MIKDKYRRNWEWGVTAFLVICGCIPTYFLFQRWDGVARIIRRLLSILEPIFIGFALAFILDSLLKTITSLLRKLPLGRKKDPERTWKGYRVIAIILSEIVFVAVVTVLLISVIPQFDKSLGTLINNLPSYVASIKKLLIVVQRSGRLPEAELRRNYEGGIDTILMVEIDGAEDSYLVFLVIHFGNVGKESVLACEAH